MMLNPFGFNGSFCDNEDGGLNSFFQFCDEFLAKREKIELNWILLPHFQICFQAGERDENEVDWFSGVYWFGDIFNSGEQN